MTIKQNEKGGCEAGRMGEEPEGETKGCWAEKGMLRMDGNRER